MVNSQGFIVNKTGYKKGKRGMTMIFIRIILCNFKRCYNVYDLVGYLGVEKDYPQQKNHHYRVKRREIRSYLRRKKSITRTILKEGYSDMEHIICKVKKYKILADAFRNKLRKYNKISDIVIGLINHRTMNHS